MGGWWMGSNEFNEQQSNPYLTRAQMKSSFDNYPKAQEGVLGQKAQIRTENNHIDSTFCLGIDIKQ